MTLCVCGHPSEDHAQFDHGEYCFSCSCRDWRPIHKEAVDSGESHESTASLAAGVTPEGLAEETVADDVKVTPPTDEARGHVHRHPTGSPFYHDECDLTDEARATITETEFGRFKAVVRDGEHTWLFECPGCGQWAELDDDQWEGGVSVDHTDTGCNYHETHNFFVALAVAGNQR